MRRAAASQAANGLLNRLNCCLLTVPGDQIDPERLVAYLQKMPESRQSITGL
jgi:hypothetical protein